MNIAQIQKALHVVGINSYTDSCNPTTQLHFDYKNRGFYFEEMVNDGEWELYEVGPSTMHGIACTQKQMFSLLSGI